MEMRLGRKELPCKSAQAAGTGDEGTEGSEAPADHESAEARLLGGPAFRHLTPVPPMNDRSVVGREVNPSRWNSQADAFSAEATKEPFPQLVLDPVLVDEGRDMVPHRKVQ